MRLHPEKGVNPRMTFCQRCGGDSPVIILLGAVESKYKHRCGQIYFGTPGAKDYCPKCKDPARDGLENIGNIGEHERLPGGLCDKCEAEVKALNAEVALGGVLFKCRDCPATGVVKHDSEFAKDWQSKHPGVGREFSKRDCPACGPKEAA